MGLIIDVTKAKNIAHDMRRAAREEEFAPLDAVVMKQIPGKDMAEAEAKRQEIRDKYAVIQQDINTAQTTEEIKAALGI